ncbi:3081_t:CDS:10 [Cetraspora pellucida]|uniref:3081_t:CDS:1 n=1 Tax=Cetraspora pellucida TaxID=1433469 RepID=A0A9N9GQ61_9GLOM|nr:3081_t:CDS:10 [Cetraspora pellucida]
MQGIGKELGYVSKQPPKLPGYASGWEWVTYPVGFILSLREGSFFVLTILSLVLKLQADGKDVQMFWTRVELKQAEVSLKKADVKKNSVNSITNDNTIATVSSSSHKKIKTTSRRSIATSSSTRLQDPDESVVYTEIYGHSPCRFSFFTSSEISFDDYLNQSRIKSGWKLKDGRPIADIINTKTADAVKLILEKDKKVQTQFIKSVIRLGLSSIIDLSSEFENGMFTWFGQEWVDIKRKVYEIVNMEPPIFEGEIKNIIDTMCERYRYHEARDYLYKMRASDCPQTVEQIATIYFYVIDEFLKNPFIFVDNTGKCQELSEIEYAITMTAPIMNTMFSDGETLSNVMHDRRRKIDLKIIHKTKGLGLSHSECARAPTPAKVVHDRSKCLRTLKGVLDNFLKEDLSNEDVQDSKILGIQFSGLNGQIIGIDLLDDGLYFGLEGPTFNFPAQLTDIKCLRST